MRVSSHPAQALDNAPLVSTRSPHWSWGQPGRYSGSAGYRYVFGGGSRTSKSHCDLADICFASYAGWLSFYIRQHQREVCPLSRGVMSKLLSAPLQGGLRFLPPPLPAAPSPPLRLAFPHGRATGLPRSADVTERVRSCLWAGGTSSTAEEQRAPAPGHIPFGPSLSAASGFDTKEPHLACLTSRPLRHFTWVDHTTPSWLPTALLLAVAVSAHTYAASPKAEATLSRRLRTPPLPATHAAVGYSWQNRRLCQQESCSTAVTSATSCRTAVVLGELDDHFGSSSPLSLLALALSSSV